jgi:hypothetical protein
MGVTETSEGSSESGEYLICCELTDGVLMHPGFCVPQADSQVHCTVAFYLHFLFVCVLLCSVLFHFSSPFLNISYLNAHILFFLSFPSVILSFFLIFILSFIKKF